MMLYGGGLSNANIHSHIDLPLLVVGGGAGRTQGRPSPEYRTRRR